MPTPASLSFAPDPAGLAQALDWLEALAEQQQWPTRTGLKLKLCMDEALTNIIMYGFQNRQSLDTPCVELRVQQDAHTILLDITDNGSPFDPTQQQTPPLAASLDEASIGGHGLRLMRHYLQEILYHRTAQHNHLRLVAALDA